MYKFIIFVAKNWCLQLYELWFKWFRIDWCNFYSKGVRRLIKLTEDVLEKLDNEVDLSQLLYAVDDFAELRESASDGRNELLQLYELLRRLIQEERTPGKRDGEKILS